MGESPVGERPLCNETGRFARFQNSVLSVGCTTEIFAEVKPATWLAAHFAFAQEETESSGRGPV
jgi:hypothetical protein